MTESIGGSLSAPRASVHAELREVRAAPAEYVQPPYIQSPAAVAAANAPPVERHFLANLFGGVVGALGSLFLLGTPLGWIGAGLFAFDAFLDFTTGKGVVGNFATLIGWDSMKNTRSFGSTIAETLSPPQPYGYRPAQRYPAS